MFTLVSNGEPHTLRGEHVLVFSVEDASLGNKTAAGIYARAHDVEADGTPKLDFVGYLPLNESGIKKALSWVEEFLREKAQALVGGSSAVAISPHSRDCGSNVTSGLNSTS